MGMPTYTDRELSYIEYQKQGSYDDKPIDVVSRVLFHRKAIGTLQTLSFFDGAKTDPTVTNVAANQLPATESFVVEKVSLRGLFIGAKTTPNALLTALYDFLSQGLLTVKVDNKADFIELPTGMFVPANALAADNAALTNMGNSFSVTDYEYEMTVPKVIGEKVGFSGKFVGGAAPAAILNTASVQLMLCLHGTTIRGK